ncbi:hypothetical protein AMAG_20476 [Allomyces macrogynus ATCC 38327]|uniref:Telomerase ribonucleoprotein complex - RNA-binding domain-containing protein n=1 Tax=Allomyces macrogynus (strain ATCC 38327) TaxID=578462 RepID=A0A0L0TB01_ALLM3|nr:hypothetical protein AMAG_20476 [Allomyces macrogynus ATCC 38327]|eukprot:KNE71896.1 hypothetical protein AMAG_20476 [Allomyces macrogynus ATCC 38327]
MLRLLWRSYDLAGTAVEMPAVELRWTAHGRQRQQSPNWLCVSLANRNAAKASVASLTDRHVRKLLNAHCPAVTQTVATPPLALAMSGQHVSGFLQAIIDHIFPVDQTWGSEANHHRVVQGIRTYVQLLMEERVYVHDLMQGNKVRLVLLAVGLLSN